MANNEIHISYGKFLICKMAEQLANTFEGKITIDCVLPEYTFQKEICQLTFDWSDENYCSNKIHVRDFFPFTVFYKYYDWDDGYINVMIVILLLLLAVTVNFAFALIIGIISETIANIVFFALFILEIIVNFIVKFKHSNNLIYKGDVFND